MAWLVAFIGGLGHFTAIVANFAMFLGLALSKISPLAHSPSTAMAVPQGQPSAIANATHIIPTSKSYYVSINQYKVRQIWSFLSSIGKVALG